METPKIQRAHVLRAFVALLVLGAVLIAFADLSVQRVAAPRLYTAVEEVPAHKTALVLGTSKYIADGRRNLFYVYRIDATVALYEAGRVEYVLISGDNGSVHYSEPDTMRADLIAAGIPSEAIYLDYAGFRTWDSIVRAKEVFLQEEFVVVSQPFHVARALYAAQANGIDAVGFTAQDVPVARSPRVWLRERLARVKAVLDVVLKTKPTYLGDTIEIGVDPPVTNK